MNAKKSCRVKTVLSPYPIVFEATATSYFSKSSMTVPVFSEAKAVNGKSRTYFVVHNRISLNASDSDCLLTTACS